MTSVRVFDPAMCCSTGICGPSIDPKLVRFSADLDWLKAQGVSVERFNLSQQPGAFVEDAAVKTALETKGEACLPLVEVNGEVKSSGVYPSRDDLATWAGIGSARARLELAEPEMRSPSGEAAGNAKSGGCCGPKAEKAALKPSGDR